MRALFVAYGGGHVEMCLPVMRALRECMPGSDVRLLALTTAYCVAQRAGESPLGYRDFCDHPDAAQALRYGESLLPGNQHPAVSREESVAYLGFNFLEWVAVEGEAHAFARWQQTGRQGFLPVNFFNYVLQKLKPDVVVTTNAPRSEQAVIEAAAAQGIPSLVMVDLFALPGDPFLARSTHATRITVLAQTTRTNLIAAGVAPQRIVITGNPEFDKAMHPDAQHAGRQLRQQLQWPADAPVLFWAGDLEPEDAPNDLAGPTLGQAVQTLLLEMVRQYPALHLIIRYHPNTWQHFTPPEVHPRVYWSQPDRHDLLPALVAANVVLVQGSTVGAQAWSIGKLVWCLTYAPQVQRSGMDYARLGLGSAIPSLDALAVAVGAWQTSGTASPDAQAAGPSSLPSFTGNAAHAIAREILALTENLNPN